jgi:hypothetical protein
MVRGFLYVVLNKVVVLDGHARSLARGQDGSEPRRMIFSITSANVSISSSVV